MDFTGASADAANVVSPPGFGAVPTEMRFVWVFVLLPPAFVAVSETVYVPALE